MEYRQSYHWDKYHGVFKHMDGVYSVPLQGAYNPPGYAQPRYDQYYQQYPPTPPQQQHDTSSVEMTRCWHLQDFYNHGPDGQLGCTCGILEHMDRHGGNCIWDTDPAVYARATFCLLGGCCWF
ncbi:hypothetical protein Tco_0481870 [Tanacetum coccineum]